MRMLEEKFGFNETFSHSEDMLTYEQFVVLVQETINSTASSIFAVFVIVIVITGSLLVSVLVVISTALNYFFLLASVPLQHLTFNNIIVVHLLASLGLSVLYSVHIALTFLMVQAPKDMPAKRKRVWKARVALSRLGSSVLHGSIATLIAILIVGIFAQKSYIFRVFFKTWLAIVLVGMANAFILIPILLSLFGPVHDFEMKKVERARRFLSHMSKMSELQRSAFASLYGI